MKSGVVIFILTLTVAHLGNRFIPSLPYSYAAGHAQGMKHQHDSIDQLNTRIGNLNVDLRSIKLDLTQERRDHHDTRNELTKSNRELNHHRTLFSAKEDSLRQSRRATWTCNEQLQATRRTCKELRNDLKEEVLSREQVTAKADRLNSAYIRTRDTLTSLRRNLADTILILNKERLLRDSSDAYAHIMRSRFQAQGIRRAFYRLITMPSKVNHTLPIQEEVKPTPCPGEIEKPTSISYLPLVAVGTAMLSLLAFLLLLRARSIRYHKKIRSAASGTIMKDDRQAKTSNNRRSLPNSMFFKNSR